MSPERDQKHPGWQLPSFTLRVIVLSDLRKSCSTQSLPSSGRVRLGSRCWLFAMHCRLESRCNYDMCACALGKRFLIGFNFDRRTEILCKISTQIIALLAFSALSVLYEWTGEHANKHICSTAGVLPQHGDYNQFKNDYVMKMLKCFPCLKWLGW